MQIQRVAIVDTENTSTNSHEAELMEVGASLWTVDTSGISLLEQVGVFECLNEPRMAIPQDVVDLTGITPDMVRASRLDVEGLTELLRKADLIIAHNAAYDRPILERYGLPPMRWGCSMVHIDWKRQLVGRSLPALAREFHLPYTDTHRAMGDVKTLSALLGCSSRWEHRRTHATFLAELLDAVKAEWGVIIAAPIGKYPNRNNDAIKQALGEARWSDTKKAYYRVIRRFADPGLPQRLAEAYGGKMNGSVEFMPCDITDDFERKLGLQPEKEKVAA